MGDIQRYRLKRKGPREITPDPDGFVVRFTDHERVVAEAVQAERERISRRIEALVNEPNRDETADQSMGYGMGLAAALSVIDDEPAGEKEEA